MPRTTRHVWVTGPGPHDPPQQGLVLDWRRNSYRWSALVVLVVTIREDHTPVTVQQWYPATRLIPVPADFNNLPDRLKLHRAAGHSNV